MAKRLSERHKKFVAAYLVSLNATKAAIAAGYSENGASVAGTRLLANARVQEAIERKGSDSLEKHGLTPDRTLRELARLAYFDPRKMFNSDGSCKQITELDDDSAAAVAGLEVAELFEGSGEQKHAYGLLKKYKIASKTAALDLAMKYHKLIGSDAPTANPVVQINIVAPQVEPRHNPADLKPEFDVIEGK